MMYTPIKCMSIINTWLGSVVGVLPPIMGWIACMGSIGSGGLVMAAILCAWQFSHFNSLSWNHWGDYSWAGYQMMALDCVVESFYVIALLPSQSVWWPLTVVWPHDGLDLTQFWSIHYLVIEGGNFIVIQTCRHWGDRFILHYPCWWLFSISIKAARKWGQW